MGENTQSSETKTQSPSDQQPEVFCPVNLADQSSSESESQKAEVEQAMQELLKTVSEEGAQLNQFLANESRLIPEVCASLTVVLKKLGVSFDIPSENIPFKRKVKKTVLGKDGELTLTYEKDDTHSAPLAEHPPEIVMAVLWDVIPELTKTITAYRKKLTARTSFFERVKKELKTIANAVDNEEKREPSKEQGNWC